MNHWKCIIVDDEEIDRLMVVSYAKRFPSLTIAGIFKSADEALVFLEKEPIDILFLDIDMPGINGLELRKKATEVPVCIYISGHADYAIESFELETLDFIVKPLRFERFEKTMQRIAQFMEMKQKATLFELSFGTDTLCIKSGLEQTNVKIADVLYLEALKDYTLVVTSQKKHCIWSNIGTVLKQVLFADFVRIHRSFSVQKQYVATKMATKIFLSNGFEIPVGRSYKENLKLI
jgi:two-component system, LytTR family, response regulator